MLKINGYFILSMCCLINLITCTANALVPEIGDEDCSSLLLVSVWNANNVKIYDGCSGQYIRNLDSQNLINGPLGILQAPDGDLLVVSENNSRLLRFDQETLSVGSVLMGDDPATTQVEDNFIRNPSAAVIDDSGFMYAASFTLNSVVKIDTQNWQIVDQILPVNNGLIEGIDAGMAVSDGNLFLPGFSSNNVIKINLQTKAASTLVGSSTNILKATRAIMVRGDDILVAGEQSNNILVFDATSGSYKSTLTQLTNPTGIQKDGSEHFLVSTLTNVYRYKNDGGVRETLISNEFSAGTFVYRMQKTEPDRDNDGLSNQDEINLYGTDPDNADTDGDNLQDGDEVNVHGSNPLLSDTDSDGMPDGFEVTYSLLVTQDDAAMDFDGDGLSNFEEFVIGTRPDDEDTDGDGINDGEDSTPLIPDTQPEISGTPVTSVEQDVEYIFSPDVNYAGDITRLSLAIANKPLWATFNTTNGVLTGKPDNSDVGSTNNIVITVTNGYHHVNLASFELEVINLNDAPILVSSIPAKTLVLGENISIDISNNFSDIDVGDSLLFSAEGLPDDLIMSDSGIISGEITSTGSWDVIITAKDMSDVSVNGTLVINVSPKKGGGGMGWFVMLSLLLILTIKKQS